MTPPSNAISIAGNLRVEFADVPRFAELAEPWTSLASRAAIPNVFVDPAAIVAFAEAWPQQLTVLLAWDEKSGPAPRLVGAWALVERRPRSSWPFRALVSPICAVAYLGTPVIDPDHLRPVLAAMVAAIRNAPNKPALIQAGDMSGDERLLGALASVLAESGGGWRFIERRTRAKLATTIDPAMYWSNSMSLRRLQGLSRKRRQLARHGDVRFTAVDDPGAVAVQLEAFLKLEASGWKAARRSALANDESTAKFTRHMIRAMAERGLVSIQSLLAGDVPVAIWIVLYSGSGAFTWRTAYDESYGRFSPGILLLEDTTTHLLSDPRVASTDSCNHRDIGFQAERWGERHDVIDLLIDVGPARPVRLALLAWRERAIRQGRDFARTFWHVARRMAAGLKGRQAPRPAGDTGADQ